MADPISEVGPLDELWPSHVTPLLLRCAVLCAAAFGTTPRMLGRLRNRRAEGAASLHYFFLFLLQTPTPPRARLSP